TAGERTLALTGHGRASSEGERIQLLAEAQSPRGTLTVEGTLGGESDLTAMVKQLDLRLLGFDMAADPVTLRAHIRRHENGVSELALDCDPASVAGARVLGAHGEGAIDRASWRLDRATAGLPAGQLAAHGGGQPGQMRVDFSGALDARHLGEAGCEPSGTIRIDGALAGTGPDALELSAHLRASGLRPTRGADAVAFTVDLTSRA